MAREFSKPFYHSKEWSVTRDYILKRDKYLCVKCGAPAEEVHHIIHLSPNNIYDPNITMNPENLISLCKNCHFDEHRIDKINGKREKQKENQKFDSVEYEFDADGLPITKNRVGGDIFEN